MIQKKVKGTLNADGCIRLASVGRLTIETEPTITSIFASHWTTKTRRKYQAAHISLRLPLNGHYYNEANGKVISRGEQTCYWPGTY